MSNNKKNLKAQRKKQQRKHIQKRKKKQQRRKFTATLWIVGIVGAIALVIFLLQQQDAALAGDRVEQLAAEHMPACTPRYNTTPPTSGCHQPNWERRWDIHDTPVAPDLQVHNLEHGGIMVQYRQEAIPGVSNDYIEDLRRFIEELKASSPRYCKVIMAPYPGLDQAIALTAWGWIQYFDEFDEAGIKKFIDDHVDREGPEARVTPCA